MNSEQTRRWHLFPDKEQLIEAVAWTILRYAEACIAHTGAFHICLAGGTTPATLYTWLAKATGQDWNAWQIYYGDERCLPIDHPERNSTMAESAWLGHVSIPAGQIHTIPAELGPEQGATTYRKVLPEKFHLVLLGLGEDGHTASLFPGNFHGDTTQSVIAVTGAAKPPAERVSLTPIKLAQADRVFFLVTGKGKRQAVTAWHDRDQNIPAKEIRPIKGVDIYTDHDAWGKNL